MTTGRRNSVTKLNAWLRTTLHVRSHFFSRGRNQGTDAGPGGGMAASYESIERNPNYQELVRKRSSFGWSLSLAMLVIYFGFILLVGYAPKFLGTPMGSGVMTVGIPIGLAVILSAFVLTGIYVRRANADYDALTRKIVEESK